jgi:hypothetical protein
MGGGVTLLSIHNTKKTTLFGRKLTDSLVFPVRVRLIRREP